MKGIKIIGAVNGLICSCYADSDIHIWNPSLSTISTLPPYSTPSDDYDTIRTFFRFGFDPKSDDYKLVKLTGFIGLPRNNNIEWWLDVEVYSMRKGSWKFITERFPSHITWILDGDIVCTDGRTGHLHWLCEMMDSITIVAFDLGSGTFREMSLPDTEVGYPCNRILGVVAGKLCMMSPGDGVCELWVMEKYEVDKSWVRRCVFLRFTDDACPLGFLSRNDYLFRDRYSRLVFHPVRKQPEILDNDFSYGIYIDKFVEYVENLVWVAAPAKH